MSETCYNILIAKTSTEEGKVQLKAFVEKSKTSKSVFTLNGTYPMPQELNVETSDYGFEIIRWQKGEPQSLNRILSYDWCKELGITTIEALVKHLVSCGHADLTLGQVQYDNLVKYGAKNWYEWRIRHWGCKWDTFEVKILNHSHNLFKVEFSTANGTPNRWLQKVSKDYPELEFTIIYDFFMEESAIVQHSGKFFDLETYRAYEVEVHSNNITDYQLGSLLHPIINVEKRYSASQNLDDERFPFRLIVVDKDAVIVRFYDVITEEMCKGVISKRQYKNRLCDNILSYRKTSTEVISFNMSFEDNKPVPMYSVLYICNTIDDAIIKSNQLRKKLHKPILNLINKRIVKNSIVVKNAKQFNKRLKKKQTNR